MSKKTQRKQRPSQVHKNYENSLLRDTVRMSQKIVQAEGSDNRWIYGYTKE